MAEAQQESQERGRCKALTSDGERCSRPAGENGFCYQHDESDPTVSETETESQPESEQEESSGGETTDPQEVEAEVDVDDERIEGILSVRQSVQTTAGDVIGRPFDGVSEITATEEGWRAIVEVIERRAVPDTQDILGRYEIELSEEGVVQGYRRLDRYRRGDTTQFE